MICCNVYVSVRKRWLVLAVSQMCKLAVCGHVHAVGDKSPQGQLEVTARRVDFIVTKRGPAADTGSDASD